MTLRKISGTKDEDVSGLLKVLKKNSAFCRKGNLGGDNMLVIQFSHVRQEMHVYFSEIKWKMSIA